MQISTQNSDYIIDLIMLRDFLWSQNGANSLKGLMRDPSIIKILHGCDFDLKFLMSDFGIIVVNLFDTTRALEFI